MELRTSIGMVLFTTALAFLAGCKSDPTTPETPPSPPLNLRVSEVTRTSADVRWDAPADSAKISGYRVWWGSTTTLDSADVPASPTLFSLASIKAATPYTISVATLRGSLMSTKATLAWGGTTKVTQPTAPSAVRGLGASSISPTSVALRWTSPTDTGTITYRVAWAGAIALDTGSATTSATLYTVAALGSGPYTFSVYAVRSGGSSSVTTVRWAGAQRYAGTTSLRMYETASSNPSGLTIDAGGVAPAAVSTESGALGSVQLALYTTGTGNNFVIGPGYSIVEYKNSDNFDKTTYISDSIYAASSMDAWYSSSSIDMHIPTDGNVRAFTRPNADPLGEGFYVRTGLSGSYHYARVFIQSVGGMLLQGTAPNRYIDLVISYQATPNLPYAKSVAGWHSTRAVAVSQVRR